MDQTPSSQPAHVAARGALPLPPKTLIGFVVAFVAVILMAALSYQALDNSKTSAQNLANSIELLAQIEGLLSTLKDAETGQRGFLLTNEDSYLEPYVNAQAALPVELASLRKLLAEGRPMQLRRLNELEGVATQKMSELQASIDQKRAGRSDAAMAIVRTDRGKVYMDRIRGMSGDMEASERQLINQRSAEAKSAATVSLWITLGGAGLLLVLIGSSALVASREYRERQVLQWVRSGQLGLNERIQGDQPLERLCHNVLQYLSGYLNAQVAVLYVAQAGQFRRHASYAMPAAEESPLLRPGDGLLGQAIKDNRPLRVRDVPAGYLPISSATGSGSAHEVLVAPAAINGVVHAALEFGFFEQIPDHYTDLLARAAESVAVAVRAAKDRQRLEELLQETQTQAEELQAGQEELRVSNEELEEQGRALRESQANLEQQQADLEQANSQLEEQTQQLENQRDMLSRAHSDLSGRSAELQRANDYKSEFLANMSHELRTPLNSTLILAKLLADNKDGNLSEQQVKFAQTISSAGNDLLTLINDVLDLSRIEAGKVELAPERVGMRAFVDALVRPLQPIAEQKGLKFTVLIEPGVPDSIETDPQRLGQILKNLLSNAYKFTERGEVSLRVFPSEPREISFAVRDTGVGIPVSQQEVIFEAFRQADGSIHRKFGGTGLGLSISRDLAGLLGGTIGVKSEPGAGSVFTLTIPQQYNPGNVQPTGGMRAARAAPLPLAAVPLVPESEPLPAPAVADDREQVAAGGRAILVIEDDARFSMILRDLVREMGFHCITAASANEGINAAVRFGPSAILLDINLPDHSGLGVLDQLKHNARTRHIPVHVISVADYKREALELGAIGYMLKPAPRDQLIEALRRLEAKFSQSMRQVLVVEDDARQRESIRALLGNDDVQITAVASASDALMHLKATTFDCMVVDFNLPDYSGYDLLEKMAQQDDVGFPPVIVYTGRALTADEEQRLRRFSKSIIIKDARSPERLLDEVTLFLHQVESKLPPERQQMLKSARNREANLEGRRVLVAEDDVRNIFALSSVLEPKGVSVVIARNGREALEVLKRSSGAEAIDLVLMDIMMPEMDGLTAMREIRRQPQFKNLPIIALTAKAMADDQDKCLAAGANDYIAKPLDVEKLVSLVRVWMPK